MDETQISDSLKLNIPSTTHTMAADDPLEPVNAGYVTDLGEGMGLYKLYDYFGVDINFRDSASEDQIQLVYRWAASIAKSTDHMRVMGVLIDYENMMGGTVTRANRLQRMHDYVKLDQQINRLKQEQDWFYE